MSKFNVTDKRFPKWDKLEVSHKYVDMLSAISVKVLSVPTLDDVLKYSTGFLLSTWDRNASFLGITAFEGGSRIKKEDEIRLVYRALQGKFLPTFLETIRITAIFNGVNTHDTTHFLRTRAFGFASDCTGDKTNEYRDIGVPEYLYEMGPDAVKRYKDATTELMSLYVDSMNHGKVSHLDARLMLPRTVNGFYYVTMNLGDALSFIRKRLDRQIQPSSDNLLAIYLLKELCQTFPFLATLVDVDAKNSFYINETQSNFGSHYYPPNEANKAALEGKVDNDHFLFDVDRNELLGQEAFRKLWDDAVKSIEYFKSVAKSMYPFLYDEEYLKDWK